MCSRVVLPLSCALAALVAGALTACSSDRAPVIAPVPVTVSAAGAPALSAGLDGPAIDAAVARTVAARRGEVRTEVRVVAPVAAGGRVVAVMSTVFDRDARRARMTADASEPLALLGAAGAVPGRAEVVSDGTSVWVRAGAAWQARPASHELIDRLFGPGIDEVLALANLVRAPLAVVPLPDTGLESILADPYEVSIDPAVALRGLAANDRAALEGLLGEVGIRGPGSTVEVWIGDDGYVRRLRLDGSDPDPDPDHGGSSGDGSTHLEWIVEFIGMDQPVDIDVPS